MGTAGPHGIALARAERYLLFGVSHEDPEPAFEDIERVLDVVVIVPGHLLLGPDLELRDPEAGALGVTGPALDLVEPAGVLDGFAVAHGVTRPAISPTAGTRSPRPREGLFRRAAGSSTTESPSRA